MELPSGVTNVDQSGHQLVARLNKAIYGLKQASRVWNECLNEWMLQQGFQRAKSDPCLYLKLVDKTTPMYVAVWVDDTIIACLCEDFITKFKSTLGKAFKISDLGNVGFLLGMEVERTPTTIKIHQRKYIEDVLQRFGMEMCKPVGTCEGSFTTLCLVCVSR